MAFAHGRIGETVVAALDARRREVYVGVYQRTAQGVTQLVEPFVASPALALEALVAARQAGTVVGDLVMCGDGCLSADGVLLELGILASCDRPHAGSVASLAVSQLRHDVTVNEPFELLYLRAPDAEITWRDRWSGERSETGRSVAMGAVRWNEEPSQSR